MGTVIVNLTPHRTTPEQAAAGVVDLPEQVREELLQLLTFETLPDYDEVLERAETIADLAVFNGLGEDDDEDPIPTAAMIGGVPFLMAPLEAALRDRGIEPVYAFSRLEAGAVSETGGDARPKRARHLGFVRAGL